MPRIKALPDRELGLFARLVAWWAKRRLGKVPGPLRVVANDSTVLQAVVGFEFAAERFTKIEPRLLCLASLRTATLVGCPF
ncbi:MAG TPA: hypothetical protein VFG69_03980 [Nannocystaceae bacterium]|nr:hypothetical protein [Nannocystaceae bacterium]